MVAVVSYATVRRVSLTSPVRAGSYATLKVNVKPRARCAIAVTHAFSNTTQLAPKTGTQIRWRWKVGTKPGIWPVVIRCGKSGTLRTKITVLAAVPQDSMTLTEAATLACSQASARVQTRYASQLVPITTKLADFMRHKYQTDFACGFFLYFPGHEQGSDEPVYYLLSVKSGTAPCAFVVSSKKIFINVNAYPGGPPDGENYVVTCSSLRG